MPENNDIENKIKIKILENNEVEREKSNNKYAVKLVEKVVFGLVGLILTAVVVAWIALIIK